MAGGLGNLFITVGADISGFSSAMGNVNDQLRGAVREVEKTTAGWSKAFSSMQTVGLGMTAAITAPLVGLATLGTTEFNKFELVIRQVTSLLGAVSEVEFQKLMDQTAALSQRLGIDAVKAAQGLYEAISAGVPKENALAFLEIAAKAAIAGVTDTKVAVDGLTSIMNAYQLSASETTTVADAMFMAVNLGKFQFADLAASISTAIPIAAQLGISFQEVLSAAATLTKQGFSVGEAMTAIRAGIVAIISPNKQMNALFEELKVTSGEVLLKQHGLAGGFTAIRDAAKGSATKIQEALGRVEGLGAVLGLTGGHAAEAAADLKKVTESAGATALAFDQINKSGARGFEGFKASVQALGIAIGQELAPTLQQLLKSAQPLIQWAIDAVKWFGALPEPIQTIALGFTALLAAGGPLLYMVGTLGHAFIGLMEAKKLLIPLITKVVLGLGALSAPTLLAAAGVAAVAAALVALGVWVANNWDPIVAVVVQAWDGISDTWNAAWGVLTSVLSIAWDPIANLAKTTWTLISSIVANAWAPVAAAFTAAWAPISSALMAVWDGIKTAASAVWGAITATIQGFLNIAAKIPGVAKLMNLDEVWESAKKTSVALSDTAKATGDIAKSAKIAEQPIGKLNAAKVKLSKTADKASKSTATLAEKQVELAAKTELATVQFIAIEERMDGLAAIKQMKSFFPAAWFKSQKDALKLLDDLAKGMDDIQTKQQGARNVDFALLQLKPVVDLAAAYKTLGISIQDAGVTERTALQQKSDDAKKAYDIIAASGTASADTIKKAFNALKDAQIAASKEARDKITLENTGLGDFLHAKFSGFAEEIKKPFEGAFDNIKKSLSSFGTNFSNALLGAGSVSEMFSAAGKNLLDAFRNSFDLIKGKAIEFLGDLVQSFINWGLDKLKDFVTGMLDSVTNGFVTKLSEKLAVALGGDAASAAATAAGGAASAAGGASSAAGSVASAASSGIMGMVNMISGIATSVSSVISNFQQMGMNKSLDLIEHSTRYGEIHLGHILDKANDWWPKNAHLVDIWGEIGVSNNHLTNMLGKLYDINLSLFELPMRLQEQFSGTGSMAGMEAVGGGGTFIININYPTLINDRQIDEFAGMLTRRMKMRNA